MAVTAADYQELILLEVGAGLEGFDAAEQAALDKLSPRISKIWEIWAWKGAVLPQLQYLYAKRHAIDVMIGGLRDTINASLNDFNVSDNQTFQNLMAMRDAVTQDIEELEKSTSKNQMAVSGTMRQTAPIMPDSVFQPDPNSRVYRGDPLMVPEPLDNPPDMSGGGTVAGS